VGIANTIHPNSMPVPKRLKSKETTLKEVKEFGNNALNSLKQESKNDW